MTFILSLIPCAETWHILQVPLIWLTIDLGETAQGHLTSLWRVLFYNRVIRKDSTPSLLKEPEGREKANPVHTLKEVALQWHILESGIGPFSFCHGLWPLSAENPIVDTADNVFINSNEEAVWQQNLDWHWLAKEVGRFFPFLTKVKWLLGRLLPRTEGKQVMKASLQSKVVIKIPEYCWMSSISWAIHKSLLLIYYLILWAWVYIEQIWMRKGELMDAKNCSSQVMQLWLRIQDLVVPHFKNRWWSKTNVKTNNWTQQGLNTLNTNSWVIK